MRTVYKVKVNRNYMRVFPFDLIYLVHADVRYLLPRLFPASLCFPIEDHLKTLVESLWHKSALVVEDTHAERHRGNGRTVLTQFVPLEQLETYFLIVPILLETKIVEETVGDGDNAQRKLISKHRGPRYITAPRHVKPIENQFSKVFTHATVLFTPRGPMRPICLACPRHLLQLQGKCELGCKECYRWLTMQGDQAMPIEEKEATDEQLSGTGADIDNAPTE